MSIEARFFSEKIIPNVEWMKIEISAHGYSVKDNVTGEIRMMHTIGEEMDLEAIALEQLAFDRLFVEMAIALRVFNRRRMTYLQHNDKVGVLYPVERRASHETFSAFSEVSLPGLGVQKAKKDEEYINMGYYVLAVKRESSLAGCDLREERLGPSDRLQQSLEMAKKGIVADVACEYDAINGGSDRKHVDAMTYENMGTSDHTHTLALANVSPLSNAGDSVMSEVAGSQFADDAEQDMDLSADTAYVECDKYKFNIWGAALRNLSCSIYALGKSSDLGIETDGYSGYDACYFIATRDFVHKMRLYARSDPSLFDEYDNNKLAGFVGQLCLSIQQLRDEIRFSGYRPREGVQRYLEEMYELHNTLSDKYGEVYFRRSGMHRRISLYSFGKDLKNVTHDIDMDRLRPVAPICDHYLERKIELAQRVEDRWGVTHNGPCCGNAIWSAWNSNWQMMEKYDQYYGSVYFPPIEREIEEEDEEEEDAEDLEIRYNLEKFDRSVRDDIAYYVRNICADIDMRIIRRLGSANLERLLYYLEKKRKKDEERMCKRMEKPRVYKYVFSFEPSIGFEQMGYYAYYAESKNRTFSFGAALHRLLTPLDTLWEMEARQLDFVASDPRTIGARYDGVQYYLAATGKATHESLVSDIMSLDRNYNPRNPRHLELKRMLISIADDGVLFEIRRHMLFHMDIFAAQSRMIWPPRSIAAWWGRVNESESKLHFMSRSMWLFSYPVDWLVFRPWSEDYTAQKHMYRRVHPDINVDNFEIEYAAHRRRLLAMKEFLGPAYGWHVLTYMLREVLCDGNSLLYRQFSVPLFLHLSTIMNMMNYVEVFKFVESNSRSRLFSYIRDTMRELFPFNSHSVLLAEKVTSDTDAWVQALDDSIDSPFVDAQSMEMSDSDLSSFYDFMVDNFFASSEEHSRFVTPWSAFLSELYARKSKKRDMSVAALDDGGNGGDADDGCDDGDSSCNAGDNSDTGASNPGGIERASSQHGTIPGGDNPEHVDTGGAERDTLHGCMDEWACVNMIHEDETAPENTISALRDVGAGHVADGNGVTEAAPVIDSFLRTIQPPHPLQIALTNCLFIHGLDEDFESHYKLVENSIYGYTMRWYTRNEYLTRQGLTYIGLLFV